MVLSLKMQTPKIIIIGTPKSDKPIKLKILDKKLHYKLLFQPDLYFGEAYTRWRYSN